ncbi:MAG: hypothetical protein G01um10142_548, partial [Parcubacteria group bacterium Gr01-1014_2]
MKDWYLLVKGLWGVGLDSAQLVLESLKRPLKRYGAFLKKTSAVLGGAFGFLLILFIVGAFTNSREVRGASLFMMGTTVVLWMLAAFPVVLAIRLGYDWGPVKKTVRLIGFVGLWFYFAAAYFSL